MTATERSDRPNQDNQFGREAGHRRLLCGLRGQVGRGQPQKQDKQPQQAAQGRGRARARAARSSGLVVQGESSGSYCASCSPLVLRLGPHATRMRRGSQSLQADCRYSGTTARRQFKCGDVVDEISRPADVPSIRIDPRSSPRSLRESADSRINSQSIDGCTGETEPTERDLRSTVRKEPGVSQPIDRSAYSFKGVACRLAPLGHQPEIDPVPSPETGDLKKCLSGADVEYRGGVEVQSPAVKWSVGWPKAGRNTFDQLDDYFAGQGAQGPFDSHSSQFHVLGPFLSLHRHSLNVLLLRTGRKFR